MNGKSLTGACRKMLIVGLLAAATWVTPMQAQQPSCCDTCRATFAPCVTDCLRHGGVVIVCGISCGLLVTSCGLACIPAEICVP